MPVQSVRRGAWQVIFGEGDERWSMGDPGAPRVSAARYVAAHAPLQTSTGDVGVLASIVDDMRYLVHDCPSTKLACEKLSALRAAVRKLGPVEDDSEAPSLRAEKDR